MLVSMMSRSLIRACKDGWQMSPRRMAQHEIETRCSLRNLNLKILHIASLQPSRSYIARQATLVRRAKPRFSEKASRHPAKSVERILKMLSDSGYASDDKLDFKSEDGSEDGTPVILKIEDEGAYGHLTKGLVVDAVTRGPVTEKTRLAALYGYDDIGIENSLVRSLANSASLSVPCQLETADGKHFPPSTEIAQQGYYMRITFSNLYLAPAVRLECRLIKPWRQHEPYLTLATDFHFNDYCAGEDNMISGYTHQNATINFHAGRATCSGFNLISRCESYLGEEEREVIEVMRSFIQPKERHELKLHLKGYSLTPRAEEHLNNIKARLPGGSGTLLPSIGQKEYAPFEGPGDLIKCNNGSMLRPAKLMSGEVPFPMVPLESGTTFGSVREAAVQLAYSATIADDEAREALRLWAAVPHDADLHVDSQFPVLAIYFRQFDRLGGRRSDSDLMFKLPRDLNCGFVTYDPASRQAPIKLEGFLLGTNPGITKSGGQTPGAVFRITSHTKEKLAQIYHCPSSRSFPTKCSPHYSSFTFGSQLEAVRMLQATRNKKWWPVLLNQKHDDLKIEDPTLGITSHQRERAEKWLRNWKPWNPEQLAIIDSITAVKGGLNLIMGPAATGKTLLQRGIAIYFYSLGYHVAALAPANDNANKLAKDLIDVKAELDWIDFDFLRLFPGSRDIPVDEMSAQQAGFRKEGHHRGDVLPFKEMLNKLEEDPDAKGAHRTYGVVESVIRHAEEKTLSLFKAFNEGDGEISAKVNTWDVLRELIAAWRANELDLDDSKQMDRFRLAYNGCKGQVIGLNRFMITTTGNVRSREMREHWFCKQEEYGVPRRGVIVLVDEAAKDLEVNVWSGIVCERWSEWVKGVFLFGDDKQLLPTNTSSRGRTQYNYYSDRLDIPLPNRLEMEGFPCHRLLEQRRMHEAISAFPNTIVYEGKLRDGPGMDVSLEAHMPGLREVLLDIVSSASIPAGGQSTPWLTDNDLRRHYIEVYGRKVEYEKSVAVLEHIDVFMVQIFPKLFKFFRASGRSMKEEVMIICAYNYARSEYDRRIKEFLRQRPECTINDIPRIMSIDSSQGDESFMVFLDASLQSGDRVGFMQSKNRFNVAITRAKGVMWMIGGGMRTRERVPPNLITQYKQELDAAGQTSHFEAGKRAYA